jgi:hypothetical protein
MRPLTRSAVPRHHHPWPVGSAAYLRPRPLPSPHCHIRNSRCWWACSWESTATSPQSHRAPHGPSPSLQSCPPSRRACTKYRWHERECTRCSVTLHNGGEGRRPGSELIARPPSRLADHIVLSPRGNDRVIRRAQTSYDDDPNRYSLASTGNEALEQYNRAAFVADRLVKLRMPTSKRCLARRACFSSMANWHCLSLR